MSDCIAGVEDVRWFNFYQGWLESANAALNSMNKTQNLANCKSCQVVVGLKVLCWLSDYYESVLSPRGVSLIFDLVQITYFCLTIESF